MNSKKVSKYITPVMEIWKQTDRKPRVEGLWKQHASFDQSGRSHFIEADRCCASQDGGYHCLPRGQQSGCPPVYQEKDGEWQMAVLPERRESSGLELDTGRSDFGKGGIDPEAGQNTKPGKLALALYKSYAGFCVFCLDRGL